MKSMNVGLNELYWSELDRYGETGDVVNRALAYMVDNLLLDVTGVKVDGPVQRRRVVIDNPGFEALVNGVEHSNSISLSRILSAFVEGGYAELEEWVPVNDTPVTKTNDTEKTWVRNRDEAYKALNVLALLDSRGIVGIYLKQAKTMIDKAMEAHNIGRE